jgi:hypothetical protein
MTKGPWKVATNYKRAQKNDADIVLWEDQSVCIAKKIKYGDANLIVHAVNVLPELIDVIKEIALEITYNLPPSDKYKRIAELTSAALIKAGVTE